MASKAGKLKIQETIKKQDEKNLILFLQSRTELSIQKIKKTLNFGGFWIRKKSSKKLHRQRRTKAFLSEGDYIEFYYDADLIFPKDPLCISIKETSHWGIWYKPPGILSQGTKFGDEGSLLRFLEKQKKSVFLVHRLDRETSGLILYAYDKTAAQKLSFLWSHQQIKKSYQAQVLGDLEKTHGIKGTINQDLDNKKAVTHFEVHSTKDNISNIIVHIETGRYHQIRRHFDQIDHPVMGDPKYGRGNKNNEGLKLVAHSLSFQDPFSKENLQIELPEELQLFHNLNN